MTTRPLALVALALLAAALAAPVWLVEFPPLLDYPNHLAGSFVLAHIHDPQYRFAEWYRADWDLYPYVTMDVVLVLLQRVFPVEVAGKLFLSLTLCSLPCGAFVFLREANPGNEWLALCTLPVAVNSFVLLGYLSFCLSIGLCFGALGWWLRYLKRPSAPRWCVLLLCFLLVYLTHVFSLGIAGIVVTAYAISAGTGWKQVFYSWLLFVPGALLYFRAVARSGASATFTFRDLDDKLDWLAAWFHAYSLTLDRVLLAAFAAAVVLALLRNAEARMNRPWLWVATALLVAFAVLPEGYEQGWDIDARVLPALFVVLLAVAGFGRRARWVAAVAVLLFLLRTADVASNFRAAQPQLQGLAQSFSFTPRNARVLPLVQSTGEAPVLRPYAHFWSYGMICNGWLAPYLFTLNGVQPLRFDDRIYSPDGFWDLDYAGSEPDWDQVRETYDFVWAYDLPRFAPALQSIAVPVLSRDRLTLYRIRK